MLEAKIGGPNLIATRGQQREQDQQEKEQQNLHVGCLINSRSLQTEKNLINKIHQCPKINGKNLQWSGGG
jgi:hypothetical protein